MRPAGRRFLLLLLLSLAGCPKRVVVNGQELPAQRADELARVELVEVRRQAAALPPGAGAERLLAFAARYRGVPTAAEALHQAGALQLQAGQPQRAAQTFATLLAEHHTYPRADEARLALARLEIEQGRPAAGLRNLEALYPRLDPARRPEAALLAARAAQATGSAAATVRWQGEVAAQATGDARRAALARVAEAVERLAPEEVERLRQARGAHGERLLRRRVVRQALAEALHLLGREPLHRLGDPGQRVAAGVAVR
ncbi:MAG TPA: penicillin-binding protein activator, partial [Anaeromyxobacteraceae bacterium]|nr:penicillin-binding protein activator [Anaeromyxobacteraceae bacterium]